MAHESSVTRPEPKLARTLAGVARWLERLHAEVHGEERRYHESQLQRWINSETHPLRLVVTRDGHTYVAKVAKLRRYVEGLGGSRVPAKTA